MNWYEQQLQLLKMLAIKYNVEIDETVKYLNWYDRMAALLKQIVEAPVTGGDGGSSGGSSNGEDGGTY